MPFSDVEIKNAHCGAGKNKRFEGLFLPLGIYPDVSLKRGRDARAIRQLLCRGVDSTFKHTKKVSTMSHTSQRPPNALKLYEQEP